MKNKNVMLTVAMEHVGLFACMDVLSDWDYMPGIPTTVGVELKFLFTV